MTLALIIAGWLTPLLLMVWALCRSAGRADEQIERMYQEGRFPFKEPKP